MRSPLARSTESWWPCPARSFNIPVLDFDQFMSLTKATSSTPYLVLNYDSANLIYGSGDWSYSQLLALAQSWLQYIVRMGYKVLPCRPPAGCHTSHAGLLIRPAALRMCIALIIAARFPCM